MSSIFFSSTLLVFTFSSASIPLPVYWLFLPVLTAYLSRIVSMSFVEYDLSTPFNKETIPVTFAADTDVPDAFSVSPIAA